MENPVPVGAASPLSRMPGIVLTGAMATGKSTAGALLADDQRAMHYPESGHDDELATRLGGRIRARG